MRSDHLSKHLKTHQTRKTAVHLGGTGAVVGVSGGMVPLSGIGQVEEEGQQQQEGDEEEEEEEGVEDNPEDFGGTDSCDLAMSVDETDQDNELSINEAGMDDRALTA